jgi:hypothetical protein
VRRTAVALIATLAVAVIGLAGCGYEDLCTVVVSTGKVLIPIEEEDGTRVELEGHTAECRDGEAIPISPERHP